MNVSETTKSQIAQASLLASSVAVLVLLAAPVGFAQYKSSDTTAKPATSADTTFATEAAQGGIAEVKLGHLAEEKGATQQVKDFGKRMVNDHTKANNELKSAVSGENISLPNGMSARDQATYDHLSKLSGNTFDKAYAEDMVKDHQKDVNAFEHEAKDGKNSSIKNFASGTLPTLQEHLKMARDMNSNTKNTTHS